MEEQIIAIIDGNTQLSFIELDKKVQCLANHLTANSANSVIGVHLDPSIDLVVALLAIAQLNLVYFPIVAYGPRPWAKVQQQINEAKPILIITSKAHAEKYHSAFANEKILLIEDFKDLVDPVKTEDTYGSWIKFSPKRLKNCFENIIDNVRDDADHRDERVALLDNIPGQSHIYEILYAYHRKATLVVAPDHCRYDLHKTEKFLSESNISTVIEPIFTTGRHEIRIDSQLGIAYDDLKEQELKQFLNLPVGITSGDHCHTISVTVDDIDATQAVEKLREIQYKVRDQLHQTMYPTRLINNGDSYTLQHPYQDTLSNLDKQIHDVIDIELKKIHPTLTLGVEDNFFELGLGSYQLNLIAQKLYTIVKSATNNTVTVSLSVLKNCPTIGQISRYISKKQNQFNTIIELLNPEKHQNDAEALVFIHALSGDAAWEYQHLKTAIIKHITAYNLYIITSRGLYNPKHMGVTLNEIASDYINVIQTTLAGKKFTLAGWSAGGLVIYEMERQLKTPVPALFFDTWHFDYFQKKSAAEFSTLAITNFSGYFTQRYQLHETVKQLDKTSLAQLNKSQQVHITYEALRAAIPKDESRQRKLYHATSLEKLLYAILSYPFLPTQLVIKLVMADQKNQTDSPDRWADVTKDIQIVPQSDHSSLFGMGDIAQRLNHLEQVCEIIQQFCAQHLSKPEKTLEPSAPGPSQQPQPAPQGPNIRIFNFKGNAKFTANKFSSNVHNADKAQGSLDVLVADDTTDIRVGETTSTVTYSTANK